MEDTVTKYVQGLARDARNKWSKEPRPYLVSGGSAFFRYSRQLVTLVHEELTKQGFACYIVETAERCFYVVPDLNPPASEHTP